MRVLFLFVVISMDHVSYTLTLTVVTPGTLFPPPSTRKRVLLVIRGM